MCSQVVNPVYSLTSTTVNCWQVQDTHTHSGYDMWQESSSGVASAKPVLHITTHPWHPALVEQLFPAERSQAQAGVNMPASLQALLTSKAFLGLQCLLHHIYHLGWRSHPSPVII